ncbi:hypothetical protein FYK55_17070 [Roseiconus nitratireducens]|uniref:Uncharacterized protein n=1 Tax=Roseiconus nitratireducens TaxID=2605748 RepID=A0A5M6D314_9BACT|nr:hypothetical protein [Roseiconus nitratireducens]KAA5541907.1 hypothetical protein FYK55_17070 [Roseiconus nitratireducens]
MQFDDAKRTLIAVGATTTEYDEARGFVPRNLSAVPRPNVHLYMLDDRVRLEILVDRGSNVIRTMKIRFEPEVRARVKANYFEALCYAVTFHQDHSYSLRLGMNAATDAESSGERERHLSR